MSYHHQRRTVTTVNGQEVKTMSETYEEFEFQIEIFNSVSI